MLKDKDLEFANSIREVCETAKAVSPPFASTVAPTTRRPWACARLSRSIDVAESFDAMQRAHVPLTFLAARAQMVDFSLNK